MHCKQYTRIVFIVILIDDDHGIRIAMTIYKMRIIIYKYMFIIIYRAKTCTQTSNNTSDYYNIQ